MHLNLVEFETLNLKTDHTDSQFHTQHKVCVE